MIGRSYCCFIRTFQLNITCSIPYGECLLWTLFVTKIMYSNTKYYIPNHFVEIKSSHAKVKQSDYWHQFLVSIWATKLLLPPVVALSAITTLLPPKCHVYRSWVTWFSKFGIAMWKWMLVKLFQVIFEISEWAD